MDAYPHYRPSERGSRQEVRRAQLLGLVPVAVALALLEARGQRAGAGLWAGFGLAFGLQLVLWGACDIVFGDSPLSPAAVRLKASRDAWFPAFLFGTQTGFLLVAVALMWLTLCDVGFPATVWQHLQVALLAAAIPVSRWTRETARVRETPRASIAAEAVNYATVVLSVLLVASSMTLFMVPAGEPLSADMFPLVLALWVITVLVVLTCVILFLDHMAGIRRDAAQRP